MNIFGKEIGGGPKSDAAAGQSAVDKKQTEKGGEKTPAGNDIFKSAIPDNEQDDVPRFATNDSNPSPAPANMEANNPAGITTDPLAPEQAPLTPEVTSAPEPVTQPTPTPDSTTAPTTEQSQSTPSMQAEPLPGSAMPTQEAVAPQTQAEPASQATASALDTEQTDSSVAEKTTPSTPTESKDSTDTTANIFGLHEDEQDSSDPTQVEDEDKTQGQPTPDIDQAQDSSNELDPKTGSEETKPDNPEDAYNSLMGDDDNGSNKDVKAETNDDSAKPDTKDQKTTKEPSADDLNSTNTPEEDTPEETDSNTNDSNEDDQDEDQEKTVAAEQDQGGANGDEEDGSDNQKISSEDDSNNTSTEENNKPENVTDKVKWWAKQNKHSGKYLGKELENAFVFYVPEETSDILVAVGHEYMMQDEEDGNALKKISRLLAGKNDSIKNLKVETNDAGQTSLIVEGPNNQESILLRHMTDGNEIFEKLGERTAIALKKYNEEQVQKAESAAKDAENRLIKENKVPAS